MTPDQMFAAAVELVLVNEGGLVDDPKNDPNGGLTNFGISQKQNPEVDVAHLTRDLAIAIYRAKYWVPSHADSTPWPVALLLFDEAVNQGVVTAIETLQEALGVPADGVYGARTAAAIAAREPWELAARFTAKRLVRYTRIANFAADGEGWFYRVSKNLLAGGRTPTQEG